MSEEEAIKLLKYKTLMFNNDVYLGDVLDKQNIEAINILLRYIEQLQQENKELFVENMKLKDKLEQQRKEYQETYKDVREEIKDYKHQLEEKDKVINEAIEYLVKWGKQPDADLYYCISEHKEYTELLEILEKGK